MAEEKEQKTTRCPSCSKIAGESVPRSPDPKGIHKCAVCRSELLPAFAAKLPEIKKQLRAGKGA